MRIVVLSSKPSFVFFQFLFIKVCLEYTPHPPVPGGEKDLESQEGEQDQRAVDMWGLQHSHNFHIPNEEK